MDKWQYTAPGGLTDFADPDHWHRAMAAEAKGIVDSLVAALWQGPVPPTAAQYRQLAESLAYVNPTVTPPPAGAQVKALTPWGAFPRLVKVRAPWPEFPPDPDDADGRHRAADHQGHEDLGNVRLFDRNNQTVVAPVRDRQDEYLEWTLRRDDTGRIRKAIFVAEGYDYFSRLFETDAQRVVEIYREFTETSTITQDDLRAVNGIYCLRNGRRRELVAPGGFNSRNAFNLSPGIVHLSHAANSLGAEVNLAGVSGIARTLANGTVLDGIDERRLLCCSRGGEPNRNSDPLIAKQAYAQVLAGRRYTLANPVGLYIAGVEHDRLCLPDGVTPVPREWWRAVRGSSDDGRMLRLELSVPAGENIGLSDLLVDGLPLRFGGQLADLLTVHLFVSVWDRIGGGQGPSLPCEATCCRRNGTNILSLSGGACGAGHHLEYPGLIDGVGVEALGRGMAEVGEGLVSASRSRLF